jgi:hypothetical protein
VIIATIAVIILLGISDYFKPEYVPSSRLAYQRIGEGIKKEHIAQKRIEHAQKLNGPTLVWIQTEEGWVQEQFHEDTFAERP